MDTEFYKKAVGLAFDCWEAEPTTSVMGYGYVLGHIPSNIVPTSIFLFSFIHVLSCYISHITCKVS